MTVLLHPDAIGGLLSAAAGLLRELRLTGLAVGGWLRPRSAAVTYDTVGLDLVLTLADPAGDRAVLTRRQTVRFLTGDGEVLRELVWGDGEQLARHATRGVRRLFVRAEGSRQAVLLGFGRRPGRGERRTITTRRTIAGGFRAPLEYCETFLERPTGQVLNPL